MRRTRTDDEDEDVCLPDDFPYGVFVVVQPSLVSFCMVFARTGFMFLRFW